MARLMLLALAVLPVAVLAQGAVPKKLFGTVGKNDDFVITLKDARGKPVKTLEAGRYTLVISDLSSIHNFRLRGPGLNRAFTSIGAKSTRTVTLTLRPGRYSFNCDPHESSMHGSFRVVR